MKKVTLSICFLVTTFVIFQFIVNPTPYFQIDPQDPIDFVEGFVTTAPKDLGGWIFSNILSPIFKALAFPIEFALDYFVKFGSNVMNFLDELFDSKILTSISNFFDDVESFFANIWKIF